MHRDRAPGLVFDAIYINKLRKKLSRMLCQLFPSELDDMDTFSRWRDS